MAVQPCVIGKSITISGSLTGSEDLVVEGRVEGHITLSTHLKVESGGSVDATMDVAELTVEGTVQGDVIAAHAVTIGAGGQLFGNLETPRLVIEDGAHFKGHVEMPFDLPAGVEAPPTH